MIPFARISTYGNIAPIPVLRISDVKSTSSSSSGSVLIRYTNGELYARGSGYLYHLGTGSSANATTWTLVNTDVRVYSHAVAGSMVVKNDGTVWAVGRTRLFTGVGSTATYYTTWTDITTKIITDTGKSVSSIKDIKHTGDSTLILFNDGDVYGIGIPANYELGTNSTSAQTTWFLVAQGVSLISSNISAFAYITTSGVYYRAGDSSNYQLGGSSTAFRTFVGLSISGIVTDINMGTNYTQLLVQDGTDKVYYRSGVNSNSQCGDGLGTLQVFTNVTSMTNTIYEFKANNSNGSSYSSFAAGVNGGIMSTGLNTYGQLGNGSTVNKTAYSVDAIGLTETTASDFKSWNALYTSTSSPSIFLHVQDSLYYCGVLVTSMGIPSSTTFTRLTDLPY